MPLERRMENSIPKEKGKKPVQEVKNNNKTAVSRGCWNIRRGLILREAELKAILETENIDIMFLGESDVRELNKM